MESKKMKKLLVTICSLAVFCFGSSIFADTKIGVLDLNKVMKNSPQVTATQAALKQQFEPRSKDIMAKQEALKKEIADFNARNGNKARLDASQQKVKNDIIGEEKSLRDSAVNFQKDLAAEQNKQMKVVLDKIQNVVNQVAHDKQLNLVVTKISTAYNDANLEITDDVIAELKK